MANDNWKLLGNERLPATIYPFWSYETGESWSWRPKEYNTNIHDPNQRPQTWGDYRDYAEEEKTIRHPLLLARGGMSEVDISALEDDSLRFPDIKSETQRSQAILRTYALMLQQRNLLPLKVVY